MTASTPAPLPGQTGPPLLTAAKIGLSPEPLQAGERDDPTAHARAVIDTQLRTLLRWQHAARTGEDPEGVHSMRVALRRMRVTFAGRAALGPKADALNAELKWLGGALGPVRDLDVLCERLTVEGQTLSDTDQPAFAEFLDVLRAARDSAQTELATILDGPRYRRLLRSLAKLVTEPSGAADPAAPSAGAPAHKGAGHTLRQALRKLRQDVAAATDASGKPDLHRLRIRGKRVRYAAEQAAAAADRHQRKALAQLVEATKELQEILGAHHDTVTAEAWLRDRVNDPSAPLSPHALVVVGRLIERECGHRARHEQRWPYAWHEVDRWANAVT